MTDVTYRGSMADVAGQGKAGSQMYKATTDVTCQGKADSVTCQGYKGVEVTYYVEQLTLKRSVVGKPCRKFQKGDVTCQGSKAESVTCQGSKADRVTCLGCKTDSMTCRSLKIDNVTCMGCKADVAYRDYKEMEVMYDKGQEVTYTDEKPIMVSVEGSTGKEFRWMKYVGSTRDCDYGAEDQGESVDQVLWQEWQSPWQHGTADRILWRGWQPPWQHGITEKQGLQKKLLL